MILSVLQNGKNRDRRLASLLVALLALLVVYPFFDDNMFDAIILNCLQGFIVVTAILAVRWWGSHSLLLIVLAVISMLSGWVPVSRESEIITFLGAAGGTGFYIIAAAMLMRHVLEAERVSFDILYGSLSIYLLLAFAWTEAYSLAQLFDAQALQVTTGQLRRGYLAWPDLLYFSFVTLTGAGYGDIIPRSAFARSLATLESTCGVFYTTVMVARLVGLHVSHSVSAKTGAEGNKPT